MEETTNRAPIPHTNHCLLRSIIMASSAACKINHSYFPHESKQFYNARLRLRPIMNAVALLHGSGSVLQDFLKSIDPEVRTCAAFCSLLMKPGAIPFIGHLTIPWEKKFVPEILIIFARESLARVVETIDTNLDEVAYTQVLGYANLFEDAQSLSTKMASAFAKFKEYASRLPLAKEAGNSEIIGYCPPPKMEEDEQLLPGLESYFATPPKRGAA